MNGAVVPAHQCGVLVVDRDQEMRELLRVSLSADGYQVATARDELEGLIYLRSHADTCLVLLDLLLSDMDGATLRAAQLHDRSLAWIPVVLMAGGLEAAQRAQAFGACGFVRKPLDLDQVRATLRSVGCVRGRPRPESRHPAGPVS